MPGGTVACELDVTIGSQASGLVRLTCEAEISLWVSVLGRAATDWKTLNIIFDRDPSIWRDPIFRSDYIGLAKWFTTENECGIGSFRWICLIFDADPDYLCQRLPYAKRLKMRAPGPPIQSMYSQDVHDRKAVDIMDKIARVMVLLSKDERRAFITSGKLPYGSLTRISREISPRIARTTIHSMLLRHNAKAIKIAKAI
jgi:hypothetical protein